MWAILAGLFSIGFALYDRAVQANYLKEQMKYNELQQQQTGEAYKYNIKQLETDKERLENVYQTNVENIQEQGVKVGKAQTASIAAMGFRVNPYQGLQEQQGGTTAQVILNETYQNVQEDIDQLTQQYNYELESINNQIDYYNDLLALLDENEEPPTTPPTDNNEGGSTIHELPPDIEENNNVNNPDNSDINPGMLTNQPPGEDDNSNTGEQFNPEDVIQRPTITPEGQSNPNTTPAGNTIPLPQSALQTQNQETQLTAGEVTITQQETVPTIPEEIAPTSDDLAEAMGLMETQQETAQTQQNNNAILNNNTTTVTHNPPTDEQIAGRTTEDILMGNYTVAGYNDYINRGGNPNLTYEDYLTMIESISNKTLLTEKNKRVNSASFSF